MELKEETLKRLLKNQQDEINAHNLYLKVSRTMKDESNKAVLKDMAKDEMRHYNRLKSVTGEKIKQEKIKVLLLYLAIRVFGFTFGIKLFENSEAKAIESYSDLDKNLSYMDEMAEDETRHENELIEMLNEDKLNYMGSVVLGLNDALVELTGALAGYTFAFQNTRLIALTGLITGISAALSMAASEYLSSRHQQKDGKNALRSASYTGAAYIFTVIFLILPFIIITDPFISLITTLGTAVVIIFIFNFYISVARNYGFKKRFLEMAVISIGVAGVSFLIGLLVKQFVGIDI